MRMGMMDCRMMRIRRRRINFGVQEGELADHGEEMRVLGSLHD